MAVSLPLGGCAALTEVVGQQNLQFEDPAGDLVVSEVDQDAVPLYLAVPPTEADVIPAKAAASFNIDSETVRYQGQWDGKNIYLVSRNNAVSVIQGIPGDENSWGMGSTDGNHVLGMTTDDSPEVTLQYLPAGTADVPEGWTALSGFIITR